MSDGRTWGTLIGGVVGFFTGGIGFAAGAAIGGVVGGLLEPKKHTETNRIDDIKVSLSKYGDGIPETWGSNIPSATCVWSTYIIQLPETQSSGKGGGTENKNYRQFIQSMWCLGKTPPPGTSVNIRKVWIDGKLNYDASSGLSVGQALATEENPFASLVILPGFDDQLPVSMIELFEGVGNVPAFRGRICIFIFGLECPGGRIPQLQFELCLGSTIGGLQLEYARTDDDRGAGQTLMGLIGKTDILHARVDRLPGWPLSVRASFIAPNSVQVVKEYDLQPGFDYTSVAPGNAIPVVGGEPAFVQCLFDSADAYASDIPSLYRINAITGEASLVGTFDPDGETIYGWDKACYDTFEDVLYVLPIDGSVATHFFCLGALVNNIPLPPAGTGPAAAYAGIVHIMNADGTLVTSIDAHTRAVIDVFTIDGAIANSDKHLMFAGEDGVFALSIFGTPGTPQGIWKRGASSYELVTDNVLQPTFALATLYTSFYACNAYAVIGPTLQGGDAVYTMIRFNSVTLAPAVVEDFIESQSLRSGLTSDQFDISTISDTFHGLTLKSPASARANITPVMTYSAIGIADEDGLLRFFNRKDKSSVVTIPYEELGYAEDGGEPGDPFPLVHLNAQELPRSITVSYNDPNFDYQVSTVKAMRYAVDTVADEAVTLDMAITGDRAATIAWRLLYERWLAQNTRSFSISRAYSYLSAGDVATFLSKDGSYGPFMISKLTDTGAKMEGECFPADSELLIQVVPGPNGYRAQSIDPLAPPTRLVPLDIPILRDQDDNAGLYFAFDGYADGWPGAEFFQGDDDTSLVAAGAVDFPAPIGLTESVLGAGPTGIVDETTIFTINIGDDVFESVTREVLLAGGGEYWAYGAPGRWEIGASALGDDLGGGVFILSRHMRGLFGTERFVGSHLSDDTFVLLRPAGMLRPILSVGQIGQTRSYRAVTKGRSFNSAPSLRVANTAEGLKPLAPISLRRSDSGNDVTITWDRRSRLEMNYATGDIPLGETIEQYQVRVFTDDTYTAVAGILIATTDSITLTAAQQIAFGLTPGADRYAGVSQYSDKVGYGEEVVGPLLAPANPFWADVALLLHADGDPGSLSILDSSATHKTPTLFGNAQISTLQSKFGGSSIVFDGVGDSVLYPHTADLHLGGDFTIELWFFPLTTAAVGQMVVCKGGGANFASYEISWYSSNVYFAGSSANTSYDIGGENIPAGLVGAPTIGAWNHIAITRAGNVYRGFINGVLGYTQTVALTPYNASPRGLAIGSNFSGPWGASTPTASLDGFIDELRVTNGVARYVAAFTPPTASFPNS